MISCVDSGVEYDVDSEYITTISRYQVIGQKVPYGKQVIEGKPFPFGPR